MMLEILNRVMPLEVPLNEFKRSKDSNRRTSLMLPGMKCPRPFSNQET